MNSKSFLTVTVTTLGFLGLVSAAVGCESKFSEPSPDTVKAGGPALADRLTQKTKVDNRIDEIQSGAEKSKKILAMFKKVQAPNENEDVYTPIDLLIDVNTQLKSKIPELQDGKMVRRGSFTIPVESLSETCKHVETTLTSSDLIDDPKSSVSSGERLTYSFKTCGSNEQYLEVVSAEWRGNRMKLQIINKNLETIFSDLAAKIETSACEIQQNDKKIIQSINCKEFEVRLSKSEIGVIKTMTYSSSEDIRFETRAEILENGVLKGNSHIRVREDGQVIFDVKKVGEKDAIEVAAPAAVAAPALAPAPVVEPAPVLEPAAVTAKVQ